MKKFDVGKSEGYILFKRKKKSLDKETTQKKRKEKKVKSIFEKLFKPIFLVMVVQSCILFASSIWGGITEALQDKADDNLSSTVSNREKEIEKLFEKRWTNMDIYVESFDRLYEKYEIASDIPL